MVPLLRLQLAEQEGRILSTLWGFSFKRGPRPIKNRLRAGFEPASLNYKFSVITVRSPQRHKQVGLLKSYESVRVRKDFKIAKHL